MKTLFGNAHQDLRREQTAAQQGYGTINNVQVFDEINVMLEKLATASLTDKQAMANLTEANATLTKKHKRHQKHQSNTQTSTSDFSDHPKYIKNDGSCVPTGVHTNEQQ